MTWAVRALLGSAALTLMLAFLFAALTVYGVVSIQLARALLVCAWLVAIAGLVVSDYLSKTRRRRLKIGVTTLVAAILAISFWRLDAWVVRHKDAGVAAATVAPQRLYYGDEQLNERTITLERGCHPRVC